MRISASQGLALVLICLLSSCQKPPQITPQEKARRNAQRQQIVQELNQSAEQFATVNQIRVLASGSSPSLSPDGKKIAYEAPGENGGRYIWIMDVNGANQKQLTTIGWDFTPQWSPDSQSIIFKSLGKKNFFDFIDWLPDSRYFTIWGIHLNGQHQRRLIQPIDPEDTDLSPLWSPDGKYIVWRRFHGEKNSLWIANAQGEDARELTDQTKERINIVEGPDYEINFHDSTPSHSQAQTNLPCQSQLLAKLDNPQKTHFPRTFGTVLTNQTKTHQYCLEKGRFFEIPTNVAKTSKNLNLPDRFFVESPNVTADQNTLIFELIEKGAFWRLPYRNKLP